MPNRIAIVLCCALGGAVLCWPAIYNGQPFFYPDTTAYVRGAAAGVERLTGRKSDWLVAPDSPSRGMVAVNTDSGVGAAVGTPAPPPVVLAGRSVYYGSLLYGGYELGGFWYTVLVQGILVCTAVAMLMRLLGLLAPSRLCLGLLTIALTPAPLYVSFLMPDIFGALVIVACAVLLCGPAPLERRNAIFWNGLLTASLLVHSANLLLCGALIATGLLWRLFSPSAVRLTGLLNVGAAILIAVLGEAAFSAAIQSTTGQPPLRPPFLMARVIADGPGADLLRTDCQPPRFVACRFADRMPMTSDDFLWLGDPQRGAFSTVEASTKRALSAEQLTFAATAVLRSPLQELRAASANFIFQLESFSAHELEIWENSKPIFQAKLPPDTWLRMQRTHAFGGTLPVAAFDAITASGLVIALVLLAFLLLSGRTLAAEQWTITVRIMLMIMAGVVLNAAVFGCLSEPHNRYQARVIWLVPLIAAVTAMQRLALRRAVSPEPPHSRAARRIED